MRIAIVGAGVSGLVTAYLLARDHDVTVFEAGRHAGGHANTVRVDAEYETHEVDTGFIVFNDRNYPNFERLLARLGVVTQPSNMSFGVSDGRGDFEYNGGSPNGLFAKRAHLVTPWFHRMIADLNRFNRGARALLDAGPSEMSLRHWLQLQRFSRPFIERLMVPQASAVWSADPYQLWSFPARFLLEFFDNHGMLGFRGRPRWRTVTGGSSRYVETLVQRFGGRIWLDAPIVGVTRAEDHVLVTPRGAEPRRFDEVVLATHADQALAMLADATHRERQLLGAIPYQTNDVVLHTDTAMLPRRRRAWASWNYHLSPAPVRRTTVTYHMNRLQSLTAARQFCVTLNRTSEIDPAKVITTHAYAHPVFTADGIHAQRHVAEISGRNRTHFAGAYWGWGFHEDGVVSAQRVAARFGVSL